MTDRSDVGYGKPPVGTQFRKGVSGNPGGRPRGIRNLKTDLSAELESKVQVTEGGRQRTLSKRQALLKRLVSQALNGDNKATSLLLSLWAQLERTPDPVSRQTPSADADGEIIRRFMARANRAPSKSSAED
jgi:hypothetical protein